MSVGKRDYHSRLQTILVFLILKGMAKMKLAILSFLCCGDIMKNNIALIEVISEKTQAGLAAEHSFYLCDSNP